MENGGFRERWRFNMRQVFSWLCVDGENAHLYTENVLKSRIQKSQFRIKTSETGSACTEISVFISIFYREKTFIILVWIAKTHKKMCIFNKNPGWGGGGGLLNKVLYEEAPPGGSHPYPLIY